MRRITTLPNKIRIVTQGLKDRDSTALGVWVGAGARYEQDSNKGVAHFLEHMAFKGSNKYSCDAIKQRVEGVGGNLNAFTSDEETCFYAKVPAQHQATAFDILADITFFPKISKKDLDKERTVILEEIKMYRDLPQYYVVELLEQLLWPGHPLGKSLAGTPESVGALGVKALRDFQQAYYLPSNVVICACGRVDHDALVDLVAKKLSGLTGQHDPRYTPARTEQDKPAVHFFYKDTEQMHLALGSLAYETNHPDYIVLSLLNIILGGNMSSRLFSEVREKKGLAYSIGSGTKSMGDTGLFMIRAGVDNRKIVDALRVVLNVLSRIRKQGVSADEFQRAKDYFKGQFLLGLEDTMDHMLWVGSALISNDQVRTLKEVIARIDSVTPEDVKRVARHVLASSRFNVSIVGPLAEGQQRELRALLGVV